MKRTYGGSLIDMDGATDLHGHRFPDLFPRLADDIDISIAARDAGMEALMKRCHHENTVSRPADVDRLWAAAMLDDPCADMPGPRRHEVEPPPEAEPGR